MSGVRVTEQPVGTSQSAIHLFASATGWEVTKDGHLIVYIPGSEALPTRVAIAHFAYGSWRLVELLDDPREAVNP